MRTIINNKIRPIYIKSSCEICNSTENLHLHHLKLFSQLISETLDYLQLPYLDTKEYDTQDLSMIVNITLGQHIQITYMTVCDNCHKDIHSHQKVELCTNNKHSEFYSILKQKNQSLERVYVKNTLIPYLEEIVGLVMLRLSDRQQLIQKINIKNNGRIIKNIDKLNNALYEYGNEYYIKQFSTSRIENGKKNNIKQHGN